MILDIKSFLFVPRQKSNILTLIYFADFIKKNVHFMELEFDKFIHCVIIRENTLS